MSDFELFLLVRTDANGKVLTATTKNTDFRTVLGLALGSLVLETCAIKLHSLESGSAPMEIFLLWTATILVETNLRMKIP